MRGLDPRIHHSSQEGLLRRSMDCRVKPGNDGGWISANRRWYQSSALEKGLQYDEQKDRHRLPV
jgi:hypothetical protein